MTHTIHEPGRDVPIAADADVLVAGGGPAGIAAALSAAARPRALHAQSLRAPRAQRAHCDVTQSTGVPVQSAGLTIARRGAAGTWGYAWITTCTEKVAGDGFAAVESASP